MSMYGKYPKIQNAEGKLVEQRARPTVDCSRDELLTVQSDRNDADINKIIARFEKAGMISQINQNTPFYGDVSRYSGLQDAIIQVQEANQLFYDLSANIRERFDNDPVQLIEFLENPANQAEAIELGIILAPPVPEAPPPATPPPATPPAGSGV